MWVSSEIICFDVLRMDRHDRFEKTDECFGLIPRREEEIDTVFRFFDIQRVSVLRIVPENQLL